MKRIIIVILILLNSPALFAQDANTFVYKGNQLYNEKDYKGAETDYRKSVEKNSLMQGNFNLGDALYKQKKFDDAAQQFTGIASSSADPAVKAGAFHNLGNSMLQNKKYQESIDAYEKSLLSNPNDNQTRYNLAYAQKMLKQQQQQNKQNKNNNNKNNQNKNQDKQNQDKNNKDNNKQHKNKQNNQQNQQQPNSLSKADAQRMLDALNNEEQATQNKLKNKKSKGSKVQVSKDW